MDTPCPAIFPLTPVLINASLRLPRICIACLGPRPDGSCSQAYQDAPLPSTVSVNASAISPKGEFRLQTLILAYHLHSLNSFNRLVGYQLPLTSAFFLLPFEIYQSQTNTGLYGIAEADCPFSR